MDRELYNWKSTKDFRRKLRRDTTPAEKALWKRLRKSQVEGFKFRRQQGIGSYVTDFYCPSVKLAIEIDGDSHFNEQSLNYDRKRDAFMRANDITVIRFTNKDVYESIEGGC